MNAAPLPPLSTLRAFEAASRLRSLSAAARELNVTQPAVAQQVRRLEEWFGLPLLTREGRGMVPTPEGAVLGQRLGEGFATLRDAVETLTRATAERPLGITLTPAFAASWLMPRFGSFRAAHPEIEVMMLPSAKVEEIGDGNIDVAIRFGSGKWDGLESERLLATGYAVVAAPKLLEGHDICEPADLVKLPWVQELGTNEWQVWLRAQGVDLPGKTGVLHLPGHLANDAIRRGEGAGIIAEAWVRRDIEAGRLVRLFDDATDERTGYFLVRRPGVPRPPLRAFLRWIRAEAARDSPPDLHVEQIPKLP